MQRNIKAGCKLKYCKIVFNILRLIERYSQYFYYKKNKNSKFNSSFNYNLYFIKRYFKFLPNFTLRLENEYKGKHKTKRKFMYPVFLEDKKSQINELSLWFKQISFKYKYRSFCTRLSIIFFNYIYFLNTKNSKIGILINKIFTLQKGNSKIFITDDKVGRDFLLSDTYKKTLWRLTFDRLKIKLRRKVDWYYRTLFFKYKDNISYLARHSIVKVQAVKYLKMLQKSNIISERAVEIKRQEYYRNIRH